MAAKFCTQCGSEVAEGKRFCGRCGAAVAQRPQPVKTFIEPAQNTAASLWHPTPQQPVVSADVLVPAREDPMTQHIPVQVEHPVEPLELRPMEPDYSYAAPTLGVEGAPVKREAPAERVPPTERGAFAEAPKPTNRRSLRLVIGIGLAALVVVVGAGGFYEWHKKSSEVPVVGTAAQTQTPPDTPRMPSNPEPVEKPDPGTPSVPTAPAPEVKLEASTPTPQSPLSERVQPADKTTDASRHTAPAPVEHTAPAPIIREVPASSKTGVLQYSGPPVHYGEVVAFSGLPGAMLRFSFDHSSWAPRISHQPDGTQTLALRSLTQQDQTQCEVRWEVAQ